MTKRVIHRVTADSQEGRRLMARHARPIEGPGPTPEQRAWNAQVEAKRLAKLHRRAAREPREPGVDIDRIHYKLGAVRKP